MRFNLPLKKPRTFEGAKASVIPPIAQLERSVAACLLWEDAFYEEGVTIAERIKTLAPLCDPEAATAIAVKAREEGKLRHAPLLLLRELARHPDKPRIADALARVIQRADEPAEFLAMYWGEGKQPLSRQVKLGLGKALQKFDAYQLAKYDRAGAVRLRDVLFMVHAKPRDKGQAANWKQLAEKALPSPDTWEVALSAGEDKKETFTRLLQENKLGYMALLRNLRNMMEAGVEKKLVTTALLKGAASSKALPFRFIAAARSAPALEPVLDEAMRQAVESLERLPGETFIVVDVSGSMNYRMSRKSDLTRIDAAAALAVLLVGAAEQARVFTFSNELVEVAPRKGMALIDAINASQPHGGTYLGKTLSGLPGGCDRIVVVTDEQSADNIPAPAGKGYMINVGSYENGVGYGKWTHINGFSESVVRYIQAVETAELKM